MKQTITRTVSIDPVDYRLNPTDSKNAPYQLEIYRTKEHPGVNVGVLSKNTTQFSHKIGDVINVTSRVRVTKYMFLTNVVMNTVLKEYIQTR